MRPALPQSVVDPDAHGEVRIFHTNAWQGERRGGGHWGGDLPAAAAESALQTVIDRLDREGWDLSPETTKILMLTHRVLAGRQGYPSVPAIFSFNGSFTNKEHPHIAYFADALEPACEAYRSRKHGDMFRALGSSVPAIRAHDDKHKWSEAMDRLIQLRDRGTVGDVLDHLLAVRRPRVPDALERRERQLRDFEPEPGEEMPRPLKELDDLRAVSYREIVALCAISRDTPRSRPSTASRAPSTRTCSWSSAEAGTATTSTRCSNWQPIPPPSPPTDRTPSSAIGTSSTSPVRGRRSAWPSSSPNGFPLPPCRRSTNGSAPTL